MMVGRHAWSLFTMVLFIALLRTIRADVSSAGDDVEVSSQRPVMDDVEPRENAVPKTAKADTSQAAGSHDNPRRQKADIVDEFLSIVEEYEHNKAHCTPGVEFNLGAGVVAQYGLLRFKAQAMVAVTRSNLLTRLWRRPDTQLLGSEYFLYSMVRSMVEGDKDIFAAGNCYDHRQYKNYYLFCPYAHRLPPDYAQIKVKDLAVEYKYLGNESEFFLIPRINARRKLNQDYNVTKGYAMYRFNDTAHNPEVREDSIKVLYEDGHWSKPYFDCGGGDIWMMTYTVPFFGYNTKTSKYFFKGTSGIDIDLQKVDIDQCPLPPGSTELNVFAGSHKCKEKTTKCEPVSGLGFRRGNYKCVCKKGFYFPNLTLPLSQRHFKGPVIEKEYEKKVRGELDHWYEQSFACLPCAPGCDVCLDARPCILTLHWLQRSLVLAAACLIMGFIPVLVWFTVRYRGVKVLKAASPMLMRIILLGAFLLYCPMIVQYFEPTEFTCCLRMWMREIGFSISYGALLLKTWRISVVFRVRSAQRVKISDTDLIKRLVGIVLLFAAYLTVRMVVGRPRVVKGTHSSGLHAFQCSWDVWDYCAAIAELCLLLWGIRLCIVVRKAPSEFNESRFISWAIYNETLLSLFLNITMFFLQSPANPDLLYLVLFIHSQLTTTVTLAFLFGSKAYLVYKNGGKAEQPPTTMSRGSKYIAAPNTGSTLTTGVTVRHHSHDSSNNGLGARFLYDQENSSIDCQHTLEKDIQDEFKRLYVQLETLKQKNMKLGNPHLNNKLSAMTEAALREGPESGPQSPVTDPPGPRPAPPGQPGLPDSTQTAQEEAGGELNLAMANHLTESQQPAAANSKRVVINLDHLDGTSL